MVVDTRESFGLGPYQLLSPSPPSRVSTAHWLSSDVEQEEVGSPSQVLDMVMESQTDQLAIMDTPESFGKGPVQLLHSSSPPRPLPRPVGPRHHSSSQQSTSASPCPIQPTYTP